MDFGFFILLYTHTHPRPLANISAFLQDKAHIKHLHHLHSKITCQRTNYIIMNCSWMLDHIQMLLAFPEQH